MITTLLSRIGIPVIFLLIGFGSGMVTSQRLQKPCEQKDCPDCHCPEQAAVSVQPFEVEKIKGLKEFVYSPQFSGSISVAGVDSTSLRKMIRESVEQAIQRQMTTEKKKGLFRK
jgi:hypothetical protein